MSPGKTAGGEVLALLPSLHAFLAALQRVDTVLPAAAASEAAGAPAAELAAQGILGRGRQQTHKGVLGVGITKTP